MVWCYLLLSTGSKRKPGVPARASRHPRVPFTPFQQATFEERFQSGHYLTASVINELSLSLDLPDYRIKIWFQNRRARERRDAQQRMTITTEQQTWSRTIRDKQTRSRTIRETSKRAPYAPGPHVPASVYSTRFSRYQCLIFKHERNTETHVINLNKPCEYGRIKITAQLTSVQCNQAINKIVNYS